MHERLIAARVKAGEVSNSVKWGAARLIAERGGGTVATALAGAAGYELAKGRPVTALVEALFSAAVLRENRMEKNFHEKEKLEQAYNQGLANGIATGVQTGLIMGGIGEGPIIIFGQRPPEQPE